MEDLVIEFPYENVHDTTASQAVVYCDEVTIKHHILINNQIHQVWVNVDAYAEELARDLLAAIVDRKVLRQEGG